MKSFSKKGILLFAGAMAICAFVLPSVASAASWGVVGSHHVLDSSTLGFTSGTAGGVVSNCNASSFTANVSSAANLEITTGRFGGHCTATGPGIGTCTATASGTRFPWTATAVTTSNIQIHGVHIDILFENTPGTATCAGAGATITLTGTLSNGNWTGNVSHSLDFNNSEGLTAHSAMFGSNPATARGLITDTQNTLTVT